MAHVVHARLSSRPCDARCMSARGHYCVCSCGGRNHSRWVYPSAAVELEGSFQLRALEEGEPVRYAGPLAIPAEPAERRPTFPTEPAGTVYVPGQLSLF